MFFDSRVDNHESKKIINDFFEYFKSFFSFKGKLPFVSFEELQQYSPGAYKKFHFLAESCHLDDSVSKIKSATVEMKSLLDLMTKRFLVMKKSEKEKTLASEEFDW